MIVSKYEPTCKIVKCKADETETLVRFSQSKNIANFECERMNRRGDGKYIVKDLSPDLIKETALVVESDYSHHCLSLMPRGEFERVSAANDYTFDKDNLGKSFDGYFSICSFLPKGITVIDFGCGTNAQSYLFSKREIRHLAVKPSVDVPFNANGTSVYKMDVETFIKSVMPKLKINQAKTMAIGNDINEKEKDLIVKNFRNFCLFQEKIVTLQKNKSNG